MASAEEDESEHDELLKDEFKDEYDDVVPYATRRLQYDLWYKYSLRMRPGGAGGDDLSSARNAFQMITY